MKIYTRTGDAGLTGLQDGRRVEKHNLRVEAYGCVDELNATLGWARTVCREPVVGDELGRIQEDLFALGAELSTETGPPATRLHADAVARLEHALDSAWSQVSELHNFILPGGGEPAARLHVARAICRRTERTVVRLAQSHSVSEQAIPYLNRLGDLLFGFARLMNKREQVAEPLWKPPEERV